MLAEFCPPPVTNIRLRLPRRDRKLTLLYPQPLDNRQLDSLVFRNELPCVSVFFFSLAIAGIFNQCCELE